MGSISAILRIQDVYNLSARAIADGELHGGKSVGRLGVDECYELGVVSHKLEYYEDVIGWMREALRRMSSPYEYSGALAEPDVLLYLSWAEYQVSDLEVTLFGVLWLLILRLLYKHVNAARNFHGMNLILRRARVLPSKVCKRTMKQIEKEEDCTEYLQRGKICGLMQIARHIQSKSPFASCFLFSTQKVMKWFCLETLSKFQLRPKDDVRVPSLQ